MFNFQNETVFNLQEKYGDLGVKIHKQLIQYDSIALDSNENQQNFINMMIEILQNEDIQFNDKVLLINSFSINAKLSNH